MCERLWHFHRSGLISKSTEEKSSKEESGRGVIQRTGNGTHIAIRKLKALGWHQEACTTGAMTEGTGCAAARPAALYQTGVLSRCDPDADPDLLNIGREGEFPQGRLALSLFLAENHRMRNVYRLRSLAALAFVCFSSASSALAQQTNTPVQIRDTGISGLWVLANASFAGMRAQNHRSVFWRTLSFIFGLPGTLVTFFAVTEGSESAYGIDLPRKGRF
jgi:hypothetical protein